VPKPLQSATEAALEHARVVAIADKRKRANRRMRDITASVTDSHALPGDRTDNGNGRKSHKPTDRIEGHKPNTAYALSDTTVSIGGRIVAVERAHSKVIVRNGDGTINDADTLAVATLWNLHRASIRKGHNA
jgi:hypothetical protein